MNRAWLGLSFHALLAIALTALIASQTVSQNQKIVPQTIFDRPDRLIVHEWGTFTAIAGKDGGAVDWRALGGKNDLPSFVYNADRPSPSPAPDKAQQSNRCEKCLTRARVRMETPVLYFYTGQETDISVKVDFPQGRITEWYPQATALATGIDWGRIHVMPGADVGFLTEQAESHYYPARETDAAPVLVGGFDGDQRSSQFERFLFYRGVGTFDLPLTARLDGEKVVVKNVGRKTIPQIILFENRGGRIGYRVHDMFRGEVAIERPQLEGSLAALESDLEIILVGRGLYEREAKAMIKTWRDSWFEEGLRVFYIVPRKLTDTILPISISPPPAELTRVMVGRLEVVTPEMESLLRQQVAALAETPSGIESAADRIVRKHGRFSEPILKGMLRAEKSAIIKTRIEKLLRSVAANAE